MFIVRGVSFRMAPKSRVRCAYIGAHRHEFVLRTWALMAGETDLVALSTSIGLCQWGRRMPLASEMLRIDDLLKLYGAESSTLRFSEVEMCNGVMFYNGSLAAKLKFLPAGVEFIEAKRVAGHIMNGLSRVRDLVSADKFLTCSRGASDRQVRQIRALQQRVTSADMLAITDRPSTAPGSCGSSPASLLHKCSEVVSTTPCSSRASPASLLKQLSDISASSPCKPRSSPCSSPAVCNGLSPLLRELQKASNRGASRQESTGCTSYQIRGYLCFTIEIK